MLGISFGIIIFYINILLLYFNNYIKAMIFEYVSFIVKVYYDASEGIKSKFFHILKLCLLLL